MSCTRSRAAILGVDLGCDGHWHGQLVDPAQDPPARIGYLHCTIPDHVPPDGMARYTQSWLVEQLRALDCRLIAAAIEWPAVGAGEQRYIVAHYPKMITTGRRLAGILEHNGTPVYKNSAHGIRCALGVYGNKQCYQLKMKLAFMGYDTGRGLGLGNEDQRDAMAAALWLIKTRRALCGGK